MHIASPLEGLLRHALQEYARDPRTFLLENQRGRTTRVLLDEGRRYDADAVGAFMRRQLEGATTSSLEPTVRLDLVHQAGAHVVALDAWDLGDERAWRLGAWAELKRQSGVVSPGWLRSRGLYGGAQGVWVDAARTAALEPSGVAVSVLHTGRHYADALDERRIIYHYPRTNRPGLRDRNEIDAVRNAGELHVPLFVISETAGGRQRLVRLAWVIADDFASRTFLMEFADEEPAKLEVHDEPDESPLRVARARGRTTYEVERLERDPTFKFRLLRRYEGRCAMTGIEVQEVLDGAHVIDVQHGGSDDPRNGLLLTADLHRAMDALLWTLHPETCRVVTRPRGPTLAALLVDADGIRADARRPHRSALDWRYQRFLAASGSSAREVKAALA